MTASNISTLPTSRGGFALTPQTLDEAMQFAGMMAKSSIVPKDYQGNPGNILVAVQWGAEIGLAPLQAMQSIAVINGRPSIWGDAMLALVRGSGLLEYIRETPTDAGCTCTLKRRGEAFEVERSFSVEDAKKAGLWGKAGPWQQHPKRMMQMRARAFALRDVFADVLRGVHVAEESQDMPAEKHMGAADEVKAEAPALPASRADRARAALAARKPAALPAPALADVLDQISAAQTLDSLAAIGELAGRLSDDDKADAKAAYKARKIALTASADVADAQAGAKPELFDPQAFIAKVRTVTDLATLQLFSDEAEMLPGGDDRDAVMAALVERDRELAAAGVSA